ncbi:MAG: ATP-binding protein [Spirochaetota bacterium]
MNTTDEIYAQLRAHLDVMPVAFPRSESGIEITILKRFYSVDEARVALGLSILPETPKRIHRRVLRNGGQLSLDEVTAHLEQLVEKKAINSETVRRFGKQQQMYGKLPFAVGLYEFQVDRLTRGFELEAAAYMDEAFMDDFIHEKPRQMRTIPINETILPKRNVSRYDNIRQVILSSPGPFALQNCICRQGRELLGHECRQTDLKETCLTLEGVAKQVIAENRGTRLTQQETLDYLTQAEAEGLVLQAQNTRHPDFICSCCSCCCAILSRVRKLPNPGEFLHSNYIVQVNSELCIGCGICLARCPMEALTLEKTTASGPAESRAKQTAVLAPQRCIGCGVCVHSCPVNALAMHPRKGPKTPPSSAMEMYVRMLYGRFGPVKATWLLIKAGLGMRV